ncbi:MAG: hypothetical protein ACLPXB_10100 [Thiobacillaceae bacterium]
MIDLITSSAELLNEARFTTGRVSINGRQALMFEDSVVLGFLFSYGDPSELIADWDKDANRAISDHQFSLRRAAQKAWNAYIVVLATGDIDDSDTASAAALAAIEEDLGGTRKIARAGIGGITDLRAALIPLLPLQTAPKLEAVDLISEIRLRATELPPRAIDAFLSNAEEAVVIQVLEEMP